MTYVPAKMQRPSDAVITDVLQRASLATVVSPGPNGLEISHVPLDVRGAGDLSAVDIRFHLAAANPHADVLTRRTAVAVIIRGPDAYISPTWYDYEGVPTWDYAFVHAFGTSVPLAGDDLEDHLRHLVERAEPGLSIRAEVIRRYMSAILGFRVEEPTIQPVFKLSQDKSEMNVRSVVSHLKDRDRWLDRSTAELVEVFLEPEKMSKE